MVRLVLTALVAFLLGCGSVKVPPPYSQQELKERCDGRGGRWHEDDLAGSFCEPPSKD